ncbi:hypothetical protein [Erwinia sp.]|uniref:hypothetical protein n=1 Tax=Erwinia citreus TaxID=558 RepID=UPI0028993831|nr:hypothetical protein [Erwinia sp.]
MAMLEKIKVLYLNNDRDEFLKDDILADQNGYAVLMLAPVSLQQVDLYRLDEG